jgi:hypothetical protein
VVPGAHGAPAYELTFTNRTAAPLDGFQLQFNKNAFALAPAAQPRAETVPPGESRRCSLPLALTGQSSGPSATGALQVAVKSPSQNGAVFYFSDQVPLEALLLPDAAPDGGDAFAQQWQTSPEQARQVAAPCRAGRRRPGGRPDLCAALEPGDPAGHGGDAVRRRVLFREDARTRG